MDGDYRGEIKVILYNRGEEQVKFTAGDRVAQIILEKFEGVPVKKVEELSESRRGSKGFGSSGKKIHLKVLRGCSVESSSGSEGSWSFINESEDVSAAVWSSEEGRRESEEHLVIPMAANEPGRSSNAVRDAAEQSNDDGAAVRGGSHERRGVDLEGGSDGAPAAAFEVAEIVSGIHRNQLRRALVEGDTNSAPVLLHGFQERQKSFLRAVGLFPWKDPRLEKLETDENLVKMVLMKPVNIQRWGMRPKEEILKLPDEKATM